MHGDYWHHAFWLMIVSGWVFGLTYGKWGGGYGGFFSELGQAISVPHPTQIELWQPMVYFTLTVVAAFALSQLFFGIGAFVFMFARGVADSGLIHDLEAVIGNWKFTSLQPADLWIIFFIVLVLAVNLPLCLWAAHIGTMRSTRILQRLRGKPLKPVASSESPAVLTLIVAVSLVAGLIATLALSYT